MRQVTATYDPQNKSISLNFDDFSKEEAVDLIKDIVVGLKQKGVEIDTEIVEDSVSGLV